MTQDVDNVFTTDIQIEHTVTFRRSEPFSFRVNIPQDLKELRFKLVQVPDCAGLQYFFSQNKEIKRDMNFAYDEVSCFTIDNDKTDLEANLQNFSPYAAMEIDLSYRMTTFIRNFGKGDDLFLYFVCPFWKKESSQNEIWVDLLMKRDPVASDINDSNNDNTNTTDTTAAIDMVDRSRKIFDSLVDLSNLQESINKLEAHTNSAASGMVKTYQMDTINDSSQVFDVRFLYFYYNAMFRGLGKRHLLIIGLGISK